MRHRRHLRGAGTLPAVLLLGAIAASTLALALTAADAERQAARERERGRVFAVWLLAADRASRLPAERARLVAAPGGFGYTAAELRALGVAPPGLTEVPGVRTGLVEDGAIPPVAMAFAVFEGAVPTPAIAGARAAGLTGVAGDCAVHQCLGMEIHQGRIEAALGGPLAAGALFATTDRALSYDERALHRRAQPGQPQLTRMAAPLDMSADRHDVVGIAALDAAAGRVSGDAATDVAQADVADAEILTVADVATELVVGRLTTGGRLDVDGDLAAASARAGVARAPTTRVDGTLQVLICDGCDFGEGAP